jgi:hypothetical protein
MLSGGAKKFHGQVATQFDRRSVQGTGELVIAEVIDKNRKADVIIRFALSEESSEAMETQEFIVIYRGVPLLERHLGERPPALPDIIRK